MKLPTGHKTGVQTYANELAEHKIWLATKGMQGSRMSLRRKDLSNIKFDNFDLMCVVFDECTFSEVSFRNCSLKGAKFTICKLQNVDLTAANLTLATFDRCEFFDVISQDVILGTTAFSEGKRSEIYKAKSRGGV